MARFVSAQFRTGTRGEGRILSTASLREMHRVRMLENTWTRGQGIGFSVRRIDGKVKEPTMAKRPTTSPTTLVRDWLSRSLGVWVAAWAAGGATVPDGRSERANSLRYGHARGYAGRSDRSERSRKHTWCVAYARCSRFPTLYAHVAKQALNSIRQLILDLEAEPLGNGC